MSPFPSWSTPSRTYPDARKICVHLTASHVYFPLSSWSGGESAFTGYHTSLTTTLERLDGTGGQLTEVTSDKYGRLEADPNRHLSA